VPGNVPSLGPALSLGMTNNETQGPSTSLRSGRDDKGMAHVSAVRARQMNTNS
jgi:hypothetical protein